MEVRVDGGVTCSPFPPSLSLISSPCLELALLAVVSYSLSPCMSNRFDFWQWWEFWQFVWQAIFGVFSWYTILTNHMLSNKISTTTRSQTMPPCVITSVQCFSPFSSNPVNKARPLICTKYVDDGLVSQPRHAPMNIVLASFSDFLHVLLKCSARPPPPARHPGNERPGTQRRLRKHTN